MSANNPSKEKTEAPLAELTPSSPARQVLLDGTYQLVSSTRSISGTEQVVDVFGPNPKGYVTYTKEGRMSVLIVSAVRPMAPSADAIPDPVKEALFSTMLAYAGTYQFDGTTIEHNIEVSWNGLWEGTRQIRHIRSQGERLIYTTPPLGSPVDGALGVATVTWERMQS